MEMKIKKEREKRVRLGTKHEVF